MGSIAGKDAQVLGVPLPPRSFPFLYTSSLEWLKQQQSEVWLEKLGLRLLTTCGFSPTVLPCGVRNGVHLGPEPL